MVLTKVKRFFKNLFQPSVHTTVRGLESMLKQLHGTAENAREYAQEIEVDVAKLKKRWTAQIEEANRAARVADKLNELLK